MNQLGESGRTVLIVFKIVVNTKFALGSPPLDAPVDVNVLKTNSGMKNRTNVELSLSVSRQTFRFSLLFALKTKFSNLVKIFAQRPVRRTRKFVFKFVKKGLKYIFSQKYIQDFFNDKNKHNSNEAGCDCKEGLIRDEVSGKCIDPKSCPLKCGKNELFKQCGSCERFCDSPPHGEKVSKLF